MTTRAEFPVPPARRARPAPGRRSELLAGLAAGSTALAAAFVLAPGALASIGTGGGFAGERQLTRALDAGFVSFWRSDELHLGPELARVVDYWFRYHVAKGAIAALLLAVLVVLALRLWTAYATAGIAAGRRLRLAAGGVLASGLAVFSLVTVMANVQGAVAPFASLLPMLAGGGTDAQVAGTLDQVRQRLAGFPAADDPAAVQVLVDANARYHAAMAVIAVVVAVTLAGVAVLLWRRRAGTGREDARARRVLGAHAVLCGLLALLSVGVAAINATSAADPAPGLLALFQGGW